MCPDRQVPIEHRRTIRKFMPLAVLRRTAPDFGGMPVQLVRQKKGKKKVLQLRDDSTRGVPARVLFDAGADTLSPQLIRGLDAVTPRCRR